MEEHDIPSSLVINFDRTPLKYAPVSSQALAKRGSKHVSNSGATYQKSLTGTFGISLDNNILQIQLIYGGKTQQRLPEVRFFKDLLLIVNDKHCSNTQTHRRYHQLVCE